MSGPIHLAKLLLNDTYPAREFLQTDLAKCLRRVCPDDSLYEAVRRNVLVCLMGGMTEIYSENADGEWEPTLPKEDLALLVELTRTEVILFDKGGSWKSPPDFDGGCLSMGGETIAIWRHQRTRPAQLDLLEQFQESGWPDWIENRLGSECRARVACSKINRKTRGVLHFAASYDRITWSHTGESGATSAG